MTEQLTNGYDYGISKVRYDSAHSHIESAIVHKIQGKKICCDGCEWRRLDVVRKLIKRVSFVTLPKRKHGGLRFGQTVSVLDKKFIRSIPNESTSDNLRNLPPILSYGISKVYPKSGNIEKVLVHKVECRPDRKIRDAGIGWDDVRSCCDGCVWNCEDVVHRLAEGDSFVTLPTKAPRGVPVKIFCRTRIRSIRSHAGAGDNLRDL